MKNKILQLALAAVLAEGFVAPAFAQNTVWKLNSDHSTGRLTLSSTADPTATFDAGIARVDGSANLNAASLANSSFGFVIYPADQDPKAINEDGSLNAAGFSNVSRSVVISFHSREVKQLADGSLAVTGDLTLSHLERPVIITPGEDYAGPVYGEPEVRTTTREVTFVFENAAAVAAKAGSARNLKLAAAADIKAEDFPDLFEAVTEINWPVVVQDSGFETSATVGEDYHGASRTGSPILASPHAQASQTIREDYPGPDPAPRLRDNMRIALNLELTRDSSASAAASGN